MSSWKAPLAESCVMLVGDSCTDTFPKEQINLNAEVQREWEAQTQLF